MSGGGAGSVDGGGAGAGFGAGAGLGLGLGAAGGSLAAVVGAESLPPPQATSVLRTAQTAAIGNTLPGFRENMDAPWVVGATNRF
jgi:hypothetical protein